MDYIKNRITTILLVKTSIISGVVALMGSALVAYGAKDVPHPVMNGNDVQNVLCTFISYFFWIVITISVIFVLVAAYHYVTAEDDTEKTSTARRTLTYGAVGVAVALCAIGFPSIVGSLFPGQGVINLSCSVLGGTGN